ncbi:alanine--glyoxylate aminotransferase family protein [Shewanella sp. JNE10-2]|uniref:pyridoxal-phosphate-dependent aminotransferase family protein n=1 Tax=unclassified Shewanella TaxID=196818 RepID=UPI002006B901|nr:MULTISPECIES: alanine--glyoxylate aminotransferase family protein [unclassified Shewanella]MCK7630505.1 alanine--glyoxylate aminotransferase family protein [Shewanella sp. JNE9-1]MCK7635039.1 alanine--glyoxylate aminotransferase family protein [Shewanella sp. JNE17]MCK7645738.1 alanine--glyoxylate aminotransferase family protein [Shewanella sp. JNE3-1]MCK7650264.1 alanine--glyoxylate aminotransferase family protein [Shewanella sp. JNE8]MCK7653821.1 alanine--glyoxylate aminotransferase famil
MLPAPHFTAFNPPRRILMGPGPSDVYPEVLAAQSRPTVGHLDPLFVGMMDELKSLIQYAFQTKNEMTMAVSAPGSAGMETCFVNLVEPGEKVIVCRNGVFGERMRQNVERMGAIAVLVDNEWGTPVDPAAVEAALKANPDAKFLAFVHAETSTGALSDAKTLCALAKTYGCLSIVDAVTSLGGVELRVDEWGIDAIYSGSQKCLSCVPGLSPVSFSPAAVEKLKNRKTPVQSWFLDQSLVMAYWASAGGKRSYHHTAPVNALYALHESLRMLAAEGLENAWQRHHDMHLVLRAGLEKLGLNFVVAEDSRLPQLNAVYIPAGVDDAAVRARLLKDYNLEIGAGLGALAGKAWRIGLMGFGARRENVALCLKVLEEVLS